MSPNNYLNACAAQQYMWTFKYLLASALFLSSYVQWLPFLCVMTIFSGLFRELLFVVDSKCEWNHPNTITHTRTHRQSVAFWKLCLGYLFLSNARHNSTFSFDLRTSKIFQLTHSSASSSSSSLSFWHGKKMYNVCAQTERVCCVI